MDFKIDKEKKKDIQKIINNSKKSIRIIKSIEKTFKIGGIIAGILYAGLNIIIPTWSQVNLRGVLTKDYFSIAMWTTVIVVECLFLSVAAKVLRKNLAGVNASERIEEQLTLEENILTYVYRIKYQSSPIERIVVKIPLDEISMVSYEKDTGKFVFDGLVYGDYVTVQEGMNEVALQKDDNGKIIIYDYFKPSLRETLEKKGITLNYI